MLRREDLLKATLVVVISLGCVVVDATYIDYRVACVEHGLVSCSD
jgi:hypothetical protein